MIEIVMNFGEIFFSSYKMDWSLIVRPISEQCKSLVVAGLLPERVRIKVPSVIKEKF